MKFIPYERFKMKTSLDKAEVLKRLDHVIDPKWYVLFSDQEKKPYKGKIKDAHFEISRIIWYGNAALPLIKGNVDSEINGCSISFSMQLHVPLILFMIFWFGSLGFGFLEILGSVISSPGKSGATNYFSSLIPVGMFVFVYAVLLGFFKFESVQSKMFFQKLLEAEEVEEMGFVNPFKDPGRS